MASNGMSSKREHNESAHDPFMLARKLFGLDPFIGTQSRAGARSGFVPTFDAIETESAYVIKGDLPGIDKETLDISMHKNVLTISGSREAVHRKSEHTYFLYERHHGSFSRSFALPDSADGEAIEARLDEGVLTLTIGKKVQSMPRKIQLTK